MSVGPALHTRLRRQRGVSMIELALVLPVLLILVLGVIDFGRALHYNNVLVNISREGANLASRYGDIGPQDIIRALENTAEPLDMTTDGMIYITQVTSRADGGAGRGAVPCDLREHRIAEPHLHLHRVAEACATFPPRRRWSPSTSRSPTGTSFTWSRPSTTTRC